MNRGKISACIITFNEEENIRRCLESVTWCDEIVVVDSFSTDATVSICHEYTDKVVQHAWAGYIDQRNMIRDLADHAWVLFLDADEEVSPALREAILREFSHDRGDWVGYEFPRQVYYLGRWIRHGSWYPDWKIRLFMRTRGRSGGVEPHDQVQLDGAVKRLRCPIYHYTYKDIRDHLDTVNRFSGISAASMFEEGRRFGWIDLLFRPAWRFFRGFILRGGWLDGRRGFMIALINSFGVAMKYSKLWELEWRESRAAENDPE